MAGFERRGGALACDGIPLAGLAARHGTPLYVYSRAAIAEALERYERAFDAVPHRICYAVKANGNRSILRMLAGRGAGADVVSGGELRAALDAGFPPERIVFAGAGKTGEEIADALRAGVEIGAESEEEIARVGEASPRGGRRPRVSLRVNPDIDPLSHPYISTGLRENKFGVPIGLAPAILARARKLGAVEIVGLHCHIGSQITDLSPLALAAREVAGLSRRLIAEGFPLETIDLGGGLGVDYEGSGGPDPAALAERILPEIEGLALTLILEPGRSLVAAAGVLLTRVLSLKDNGEHRFVIVDAGMNDLLRPSLYGAHHRIEPVAEPRTEAVRVDVVGPVCETGDFLARGRELPRVQPGELLAVRDAGAYAFSMSSTYNMRPRAAEVLVEADGARLIRRRESYEDLVRTEL